MGVWLGGTHGNSVIFLVIKCLFVQIS